MNTAVRERVWLVMESWFQPHEDAAILMTWPDQALPGGQAIRTLGSPRTELVDHHGVFLSKRTLDASDDLEPARNDV